MRYFSPCQVRQVKQQQWRRQQRRRPWCSWIFLSKMPRQFVLLKNKMQRPGIEPGPPAWQARILPLNQRCLILVRKYLDIILYHINLPVFKKITKQKPIRHGVTTSMLWYVSSSNIWNFSKSKCQAICKPLVFPDVALFCYPMWKTVW